MKIARSGNTGNEVATGETHNYHTCVACYDGEEGGGSGELLKCRVPRNSETRAQNQPVNLGNSSGAWTHGKRTRRN